MLLDVANRYIVTVVLLCLLIRNDFMNIGQIKTQDSDEIKYPCYLLFFRDGSTSNIALRRTLCRNIFNCVLQTTKFFCLDFAHASNCNKVLWLVHLTFLIHRFSNIPRLYILF